MSFETRKKVTAPRQDITGSPNIYFSKGICQDSRTLIFMIDLAFFYLYRSIRLFCLVFGSSFFLFYSSGGIKRFRIMPYQ
ncbi:MAG: hypothetical protein JRI33_06280 [Deltaproteobacteria bacterium]|nr:hypothetical protein [Deltaproteobacteria bacterium]